MLIIVKKTGGESRLLACNHVTVCNVDAWSIAALPDWNLWLNISEIFREIFS